MIHEPSRISSRAVTIPSTWLAVIRLLIKIDDLTKYGMYVTFMALSASGPISNFHVSFPPQLRRTGNPSDYTQVLPRE